MPRLGIRISDITSTAGSGNLTLAETPPAGYRTFSPKFDLHTRFGYTVVSQDETEWEMGIGYLSNATTLIRETIEGSSNNDLKVTFSSGDKTVFCDISDAHIGRASRGRNLQISKSNFSF